MPILTTFILHSIGRLNQSNQARKKYIQIRKEYVKLSYLQVTLYTENNKNSTRNKTTRINKFSKITGYKLIHKNQFHFYTLKGTRDQTANIRWIIEKARVFQKNIYFCFIDYAKAFDCVDHNKLWKILKEMRIPDHLTCLLRNLYAGQEATVRTGHETTDWFQIGKGVCQGCILSPCLFN